MNGETDLLKIKRRADENKEFNYGTEIRDYEKVLIPIRIDID